MKLSNEKMVRAAERALKRTEEYQSKREDGSEENYKLIYVLAKGKQPNSENIIAVAGLEEMCIQLHPFTSDKEIWLWGFNFERDLFEFLEDGYHIVDMTMDCHYDVWGTIEEWHNGDIEHLEGMQKYLGYCKKNGITKEKLNKEVGYSGMDAMSLYDQKTDRIRSHKDLER